MGKRIEAVLSLKDNFSKSIEVARQHAERYGSEWERQIKQVNRAASKVEAAGQRMTKAIDGPIAKVAKLGGALAAIGAKIGLTEALDLEGYRTQLETATKDTEKASRIMKDAVKMANATPFEAGQLIEGAAKFEAMGMSADKWLSLTGDMAAATNKDFDQATEALIDAQNGELERLREFGISKEDIAAKANQMFRDQEIVNAKGQIVDQEKFTEALMALMQERYAGGMEALAKTVRGKWSTVTGVMKSGLATMLGMTEDGTVRAGSALDKIGQCVGNLAKKFSQWQEDGTLERWAQTFDATFNAVVAVVGPVASAIGNALSSLGQWFGGLSENQQKMVAGIGLAVAAVGPLITHVASFVASAAPAISFAGKLAGGFKAIFTAGGALSGIIKVIATFLSGPFGIAIAAAVAAGVTIYKNWDKIKQAGVSAFNAIKSAIHNLGEKITWLKNKVLDFLHNSMIGKLASSVGSAISSIGEMVGANAQGTTYWRGGLTTVNERGGEIIDLERGARVYPHDESVQMAYRDGQQNGGGGGKNINVSFSGAVFQVREEADVERIARAIVRRLSLAERNRVTA